MYLLRNVWLEQINTANEFKLKPSLDLCIHWINPLLHKCEKQLYPGRMGEQLAKLATSTER